MDEVKSLLETVKIPFSDHRTMVDYMPYVLPMTNGVKVKVPLPDKPNVMEEQYINQTTLYTQVAGRLQMANDVMLDHDWILNIEPEAVVPTGMPGYIRAEDRLVFRVYVEIIDHDGKSMGRRFGTAGAKAVGGTNAEGTNPWETVETSALGRALAQWGFGVLPGSGIASVEEMRLAVSNRTFGRSGKQKADDGAKPEKESRQDLITSAVTWITKNREVKQFTEDDSNKRITTWIQGRFSIDGFVDESGGYGWGFLKDAQIALLRNEMKQSYATFTASMEES